MGKYKNVRRKYDGWVCLGNEIDGKDIREAIMEV